MREKTCGTCRHCQPEDGGRMCVNEDSDNCADWVELSGNCDKWEAKP